MTSRTADIIEYIAKAVVDDAEAVRVQETRDGDRVVVRLDVGDEDWGKVIGKGGRIASAMRSMLKVAAVKDDVRANLEIGD
ncbi:MAG TPA: KH domain-containing protein [Tepidiformaceae bacterium]|nr:KH domain-containing protein [Tepidiformaceae bacterium]